MHAWNKAVVVEMIESGKFCVSRVTNYAPGANMIQVSLIPTASRHGTEPFPGLTQQMSDFLQSDEVTGLANLVVNKNEYLVDIMTAEVQSTHEGEAQQ